VEIILGRLSISARLAVHLGGKAVREMVEKCPTTLTHARLLNQIPNLTQRAAVAVEVLENKLTRKQLADRVEEIKQNTAKISSNIVKDVTACEPPTSSENHHNILGEKAAIATTRTVQNGENLTVGNEISSLSNYARSAYEGVILRLEDSRDLLKSIFEDGGNVMLPEHRLRLEKIIAKLSTMTVRGEN
jgi:hypothetical protein